MDDKERPTNKNIEKRNIDYDKNEPYRVTGHPIKQCYYLNGKHFIVIEESILQHLGLGNEDNNIFFQQEVIEEDCILLRKTKFDSKLEKVKKQ